MKWKKYGPVPNPYGSPCGDPVTTEQLNRSFDIVVDAPGYPLSAGGSCSTEGFFDSVLEWEARIEVATQQEDVL